MHFHTAAKKSPDSKTDLKVAGILSKMGMDIVNIEETTEDDQTCLLPTILSNAQSPKCRTKECEIKHIFCSGSTKVLHQTRRAVIQRYLPGPQRKVVPSNFYSQSTLSLWC